MLYILQGKEYFGIYDNPLSFKTMLNFLKTYELVTTYKLLKVEINSFGYSYASSTDIKKVDCKFPSFYVVFHNNEYLYLSSSLEQAKTIIKIFKTKGIEGEFLIYKFYLNLPHVELVKKKAEEKKKMSEEEAMKLADLKRQLFELKKQKELVAEKKNKFETNLKLYQKFKKEDFVPEMFKKEFQIFSKLDNENNLTFENYTKYNASG